MKSIFATVILVACATSYGQVKPETRKHVVLPNPKLVRCTSADCYNLWQNRPPDANNIYPHAVDISLLDSPCAFGVTARYDKAVSFEDLRAAIEEQFGKGTAQHWTKAPLMSWQVESQKLHIVLETADKRLAKAQRLDVGTKIIHYTDSQVPTKCGP